MKNDKKSLLASFCFTKKKEAAGSKRYRMLICSSPRSSSLSRAPAAGRERARYRAGLTMRVALSGRARSTWCLAFTAITPTPWVERVVLGVRDAVWNTTHRPSLASTAISWSSESKKADTSGNLSQYAPVSLRRRVWVW